MPRGVAALAVSRLLREDRASKRPHLDLTGTVLAVLAVTLIVYPLIEGNTAGWPAWTWGVIATGLVLLTLFGLHQRRRTRLGRSPLVEVSLFRDRGFRPRW